MRYFRHSPSSVDAMLQAIGKDKLADLFCSIPEELRLKGELKLPKALDELSLKRKLMPLGKNNGLESFLGAGATPHFAPEWISQQLMRAEWYTSYTPYQPELSQGNLQAIFEFQSMTASLFGLEVANASMYDGATALVEALLMALRVKGKKTVAISSAIHPEYRQTVKTYLDAAGVNVQEIPFTAAGLSCSDTLLKIIEKHRHDLAAIAMASPNFFGLIEKLEPIAKLAHENDAFLIGTMTDMSAAAIFKSFGAQGADIAVGEALGFLPSLSLGGPGLGLFSTKKALVRQMPGRLVGYTTDALQKPGFVLTLSTREQHIRREKATSNICTNHNLMALAFSMNMAAYGSSGLRRLALNNLKKTIFFREQLAKVGLKTPFDGPHYNETVVDLGSRNTLRERVAAARRQDLIAGLPLADFYPELDGTILISTTELHTDESIKQLASILGGTHE